MRQHKHPSLVIAALCICFTGGCDDAFEIALVGAFDVISSEVFQINPETRRPYREEIHLVIGDEHRQSKGLPLIYHTSPEELQEHRAELEARGLMK